MITVQAFLAVATAGIEDAAPDSSPDRPKVPIQIYTLGRGHTARLSPLHGSESDANTQGGTELEDQVLFERSVAHKLIYRNEHGAIDVEPIDAKFGPAAQAWPESRAWLHKRLYRYSDGAYVRSSVDRYNDARLTAAVRITEGPTRWPRLGQSHGDWTASIDGVGVLLRSGLPAESTRLLDFVPGAVTDWFRVARWPSGAHPGSVVRMTLRLPDSARAGEKVRLTLLGNALEPQPGTDRLSNGAATVREILLTEGQREVTIALSPMGSTSLPTQGSVGNGPVGVENGQLVWSAPTRRSPMQPGTRTHGGFDQKFPSQDHAVKLLATGGELLSIDGHPTELATSIGLAPLVGLGPMHETGVAAAVSQAVDAPVEAVLSLDARLQRLADQSLDCIGHRGGSRRSEKTATTCTGATQAPIRRRSALVLLDADTGDVLAAASRPLPPPSANAQELVDFDRYKPTHSTLQWAPWQHDSGSFWAPGSTFKIVDALALEETARKNPALSYLLDGATASELRDANRADGLGFDPHSSCYPVPCSSSRAQVRNHKDTRPMDFARTGRFGMEQALVHSVNTWFSWALERTDRLARTGHPAVRLVDPVSDPTLRPTLAVAQRLGFGVTSTLDGGLLGSSIRATGSRTALHASASEIDPIESDADVRRLALGLRMHVTPLQMARVAAAVGTGRLVEPRLLLQLGPRRSLVSDVPLDFPLDRLRRAMKQVIDTGTGRRAFADPALSAVRSGIFGKTGTSPHGDGIHNNAWFIGWIDPNSLPGESRRIAFAVMVSHTPEGQTGGARAATVVSDLLVNLLNDRGAR